MRAGRTGSSRPTGGPPRPAIDPDLVPIVEHGGEPPGGRRRPVLDLSLSTNPYGPPPFLARALAKGSQEVSSYPDRSQHELTARLAAHLGVAVNEVLPAGSASELLRIAIAAFGTRRRVLLPRYSYGEYRRIAASVGGTATFDTGAGLAMDPVRWAERVPAASLVVLANPGTPSGQYLTPAELRPLIEAAGRRRTLVLVDESYLPFVRSGRSVAGTSEHLLVVFSWSKVLGTPGLPLGHAVGSPDALRALRAHLLPWSVGPFARHLGLLALDRPQWARRSLARLERTALAVRRTLRSRSQTHYFAVRSRSGVGLVRTLASHGFRVRDLASIGLTDHIRFAVRREPETRAFLEALPEVEVAY